MRIAIFDPVTLLTDPAGSCTVREIEALLPQHDVTLFSSVLDPSLEGRVTFVRIPVVGRPQVARFITYRLVTTGLLLWLWLRRQRFDVVQSTEACVRQAQVFYVHFCHTAYLELSGSVVRPLTVRSAIREIDHRFRARAERRQYRKGCVVAVSTGLARELETVLGVRAEQVSVIPNPIDSLELTVPTDFDPRPLRARAGAPGPDDLLLVFVALGHFDRKGLPETLRALEDPALSRLRLVVVGGTPDLVAATADRVAELNLSDRVCLVGFCPDVRPWLWAADAYLLPSRYETFSLALHQAAATGLPLIATPVHGVIDLLTDGVQGLRIPLQEGRPDVNAALRRFLTLSRDDRARMGAAARAGVEHLNVDAFQDRWADFYSKSGSTSLA